MKGVIFWLAFGVIALFFAGASVVESAIEQNIAKTFFFAVLAAFWTNDVRRYIWAYRHLRSVK